MCLGSAGKSPHHSGGEELYFPALCSRGEELYCPAHRSEGEELYCLANHLEGRSYTVLHITLEGRSYTVQHIIWRGGAILSCTSSGGEELYCPALCSRGEELYCPAHHLEGWSYTVLLEAGENNSTQLVASYQHQHVHNQDKELCPQRDCSKTNR